MRKFGIGLGLAAAIYTASPASAAIVISEWMYDGSEFIEIKNTGATAVDMTGYSFDDSTRTAGTLSLSSFGSLASNGVALITQDEPANFRTFWGLPESVKIVQNVGADNLLQRGDEINIYDAANVLADRLTYGDNVAGVGGPRTNNASGNVPVASYGANTVTTAVLSAVGDAYGSYAAPGNASLIGNPGNVPEPTGLAALAAAGLIGLRRRRD